jgi:glutamate decarboxylase
MADYGLNFSRPGAQVVAQHFNLVRLGRDGYRRLHRPAATSRRGWPRRWRRSGPTSCCPTGANCRCWRSAYARRTPGSPDGMEDVHVLRVVVRNGFSRDMAEVFAQHLREITTGLQGRGGAIRVRSGDRTGFHH